MKLLIVSPSYSRPALDHAESIDELISRIKELSITCDFLRPRGVELNIARAKLAEAFLENEGYTHLLSIDDDLGFPFETAASLIRETIRFHHNFLTVLYPRKQLPAMPIYASLPGWDINDRLGEKKIEVACVPFGFALISRTMLLSMKAAYPELCYDKERGFAGWNPMVIGDRLLEGDYSFAYRWRQMGETIWSLPNLEVRHWGEYPFAVH